jgi:hypothetical protein
VPVEASNFFVASFVSVTIGVVVGSVAWMWWAGREEPRPSRLRLTAGFAISWLAWLSLTGVLAGSGRLAFGSMPPPAMGLFAIGVALTTVFAFSRAGLRLLAGSPLWLLVGYQVFRIPVELLLHGGHVEGFVPIQLTYLGRNFDVLTGVTAPLVAVLLARKALSRFVLLLWNTLGLGLLANVVGVAILSMPTPFRQFHDAPPNVWVTQLPFVWLPTVMVLAALAGHLLVYRALWRGRASTST